MENFKVKVTHKMTNNEWFVQRNRFMEAAITGLLSGCSSMSPNEVARRAVEIAEAAMKEASGE